MKICAKCKKRLPDGAFNKDKNGKDGINARCKLCIKKYMRKWRRNNLEKAREYARRSYRKTKPHFEAYRLKHREKNIAYGKKYRDAHKAKRIKVWVKYRRDRLKNNPAFRVVHNLRHRVHDVIVHGYRSATTMDLIGCSPEELKTHIEKQFKSGMSWENYGKWHIDHIMPCAAFNLMNPKEQRQCFGFKNLQPLWANENMSKGGRIII